jgi:hypothetical protein
MCLWHQVSVLTLCPLAQPKKAVDHEFQIEPWLTELYNRTGLPSFTIECGRCRNRNRSATEMEKENQPSWCRTHQSQASFIAGRGWKSSNSSPLSVQGELFSLTFPSPETDLRFAWGRAAIRVWQLSFAVVGFVGSDIAVRNAPCLCRQIVGRT